MSGRPRAVRLTPPQVELLGDLAATPQMYVRRYSRWSQTAAVLCRLGLAYVSSDDWLQPEYKITDAGRAEVTRRGLTAEQAKGED